MLPKPITGNTFKGLCFQNLAAGLMFKLIIFTEEIMAERTAEYSASMVPDASLTLNTLCISKRADTSMATEAFPAMANPSFTEITDGSHHGKACAVHTSMFDDTV